MHERLIPMLPERRWIVAAPFNSAQEPTADLAALGRPPTSLRSVDRRLSARVVERTANWQSASLYVMSSTVLVIYDGECRFCRWAIGFVRRADLHRALRFCPYGNDESEQALAAIPAELRYTAMHALSEGRLYSGVDAARLVLARLPFGRIAVMLKMHAAYPFVARHRGVLGRFSPDRAAISMCRSRLVPG